MFYMDNELVWSTSAEMLRQFLEELRVKFEVKINESQYYIKLEIKRDRNKRTVKTQNMMIVSAPESDNQLF